MWEGDTRSAGDLLADWEAGRRPPQIPERKWRQFLSDLLRRCGLLTEHLGDMRFTHSSIADYLAALTAINEEGRSIAAFEELFYRWHRPWPGVDPTWRPPRWPYSYTRFLVSLWPDKKRTSDALRHIAQDGGLTGCDFALSLAEDGLVIDQSVVDAAWATLARVASTSVSYGFAARRAVALLIGTGATDTLADVMTAERTGEEIRIRAAVALAELGDGRGADRLSRSVDRRPGRHRTLHCMGDAPPFRFRACIEPSCLDLSCAGRPTGRQRRWRFPAREDGVGRGNRSCRPDSRR